MAARVHKLNTGKGLNFHVCGNALILRATLKRTCCSWRWDGVTCRKCLKAKPKR